MSLTITLDGTNVEDKVIEDSLEMTRNLTDQVDSGSMTMNERPEPLQEIEMYQDGTKIFGGYITEINSYFEDGYNQKHDVLFQDYTIEMDQDLVTEDFEDQTVTEIVNYINDFYLNGGFSTNVNADITIDRIVFRDKKPSAIFEELANTIGYEWYLDENKVINFFERGTINGQEVMPGGVAFWNTIEYNQSLEQLKNKVYVKGGRRTSTNEISQNMDEQIDGNNDILKTGYTYIYRRDNSGNVIEPTLTYDGVEQDIGIENEDSFTSTAATLTTQFGNNNDITYIAQTAGADGNNISVEYVINSANQELDVSVTSNKITVELESNYLSNPRSTANEVVTALNNNTNVTNLVSVTLAAGSDGTGTMETLTETNLSDGADGRDILYNQDEKLIKSKTNVPVTEKPVELSGRIRIPIQIVVDDSESQAQYNLEISHLIQDDGIASIDEAEKKALAELERFADKLVSGRFQTHNGSYIPGQTFRLQVPEFNLDDHFVVKSVSMRHDGGDKFNYTVQYMTKRSKRLVDLLKSLVGDSQETEDINEVLGKVTRVVEEVDWEDSYVEQPFDTDNLEWIAGPYYPTGSTDTKRVPRVGGGAKAQ